MTFEWTGPWTTGASVTERTFRLARPAGGVPGALERTALTGFLAKLEQALT
jgi:hypothetical protein